MPFSFTQLRYANDSSRRDVENNERLETASDIKLQNVIAIGPHITPYTRTGSLFGSELLKPGRQFTAQRRARQLEVSLSRQAHLHHRRRHPVNLADQ